MPLAPRHGTASWEALFGRLVLWAVLCVCRADDEVPLQFRPSARCNASCSRGPAPPCSESPAALPFCSHLPVQRLLGGPCTRLRLHTALHRDQLACQLACEFSALLSRFDCLGGYSAKWDCHTCAVSTERLLPHHGRQSLPLFLPNRPVIHSKVKIKTAT